jgi:hypothetical protein
MKTHMQIPEYYRRAKPLVYQKAGYPRPGFNEFGSTKRTLGGIDLIKMLQESQLVDCKGTTYLSFLSLTA